MTRYKIPKQTEAGWAEGPTVEARSDTAALRTDELSEGVYVAVPERSWRPRTVKVETTRTLKIA